MYNNMIKLFVENAFLTFVKLFKLMKVGFTAGGPMGDYNFFFWGLGHQYLHKYYSCFD